MKRTIGTLTILAALLALSSPCLADPSRLAIVGAVNEGETGKLLSLATAALSEDTSLAVLERTEIDSVLAEQQVGVTGVVDAEQAVRFGKILGVDVFAVIEADSTTFKPNGIVVFDATSGRRLWDEALISDTIELALGATVRSIKSAVTKSQRPVGEVRTLSFLPVANAEMPEERDPLCAAVGLLCQRVLARSPGVAILERAHLNHVLEDRDLATGTRNALLASMYRVEIELMQQPGAPDTVKALCVVFSGSGEHVAEITTIHPVTRVGHMVDELDRKILEALSLQPTDTGMSTDLEADRFASEARNLYAQDRLPGAVEAMEASLALRDSTLRGAELSLYQLREGYALLKTAGALAQIETAYFVIRQSLSRRHQLDAIPDKAMRADLLRKYELVMHFLDSDIQDKRGSDIGVFDHVDRIFALYHGPPTPPQHLPKQPVVVVLPPNGGEKKADAPDPPSGSGRTSIRGSGGEIQEGDPGCRRPCMDCRGPCPGQEDARSVTARRCSPVGSTERPHALPRADGQKRVAPFSGRTVAFTPLL